MSVLKTLRSISSSKTATTWGAQLVGPVRFLILTPLIVTKLSPLEIDVFYLVASGNLLFSILGTRLNDCFSKMLSYTLGGATDIRSISKGGDGASLGEENWTLFNRIYKALGCLILLGIAPALIFSLGVNWFSVASLTKFSYSDLYLWSAVIFASVVPAIGVYFDRPRIALLSLNRVSETNKIQIYTGLVIIALNSLALLIGFGLLEIFVIEFIIVCIRRWMFMRLLPAHLQSIANGLRWDSEVFSWAKAPLLKGTVAQFAGMGIQRLVGVLLASTGVVGFAASFIFAQNLINTSHSFSTAPLYSQGPRFARMLVDGKVSKMVAEATYRGVLSTMILFTALSTIGLFVPFLLDQIGSQIKFVPMSVWLILAGGKVLHFSMMTLTWIHNLTNEMHFYKRTLAASFFCVPMLFWGSYEQSYHLFALALTVPYIVILNIYPVQKLANFGGFTVPEYFSNVCNHFRDAIASLLRRTRVRT